MVHDDGTKHATVRKVHPGLRKVHSSNCWRNLADFPKNCFIKVLVTVVHNFLKTKIVVLPVSLKEWRGMNDICHSPK